MSEVEKQEPGLSLQERLLLAFARDPKLPAIGSTAHYTLENCLDFPRKVFPDLDSLVRGRLVLDHGCGYGWESVALWRDCGAERVFGVDVVKDHLAHASHLADRHGCRHAVQFATTVPPELSGQFDVVLSLSAFEHYADPVSELESMASQLKPGGVILLAFAEPWWSPFGSHFQGYAHLPFSTKPFPWLNVFFSEEALLRLRSQFRPDRPKRIEDVEGGLNRMTVRRFERIVNNEEFQVERMTLLAVKRLPLVTRLPLIREFLTSSAGCILRKSVSRETASSPADREMAIPG